MKSEKYILYGASFNPPHIGHFSAISQMLEEYDKVIIFPYPKKYFQGKHEQLPPINQRMKMLEIFCLNYFPKMSDRLILVDLAKEMKLSSQDYAHTYQYLDFVQTTIPPSSSLSICLGFDSKNALRKENFHKEEEMKTKYNHFYLQEENSIKSDDLRKFFSTHKNIKSKKDEEYIKYAVGAPLAEFIFKNNLYGINKKTINIINKKTDSILKPKKI